jgi:hypothetical protein
MITPEEQIIRVASENYEHGVRGGAGLALDTLESLGVLSAPIAEGMLDETDRLSKTNHLRAKFGEPILPVTGNLRFPLIFYLSWMSLGIHASDRLELLASCFAKVPVPSDA